MWAGRPSAQPSYLLSATSFPLRRELAFGIWDLAGILPGIKMMTPALLDDHKKTFSILRLQWQPTATWGKVAISRWVIPWVAHVWDPKHYLEGEHLRTTGESK